MKIIEFRIKLKELNCTDEEALEIADAIKDIILDADEDADVNALEDVTYEIKDEE